LLSKIRSDPRYDVTNLGISAVNREAARLVDNNDVGVLINQPFTRPRHSNGIIRHATPTFSKSFLP
jgi:hypothetical protein